MFSWLVVLANFFPTITLSGMKTNIWVSYFSTGLKPSVYHHLVGLAVGFAVALAGRDVMIFSCRDFMECMVCQCWSMYGPKRPILWVYIDTCIKYKKIIYIYIYIYRRYITYTWSLSSWILDCSQKAIAQASDDLIVLRTFSVPPSHRCAILKRGEKNMTLALPYPCME